MHVLELARLTSTGEGGGALNKEEMLGRGNVYSPLR